MGNFFVVLKPYIEYNDGDYIIHDESIFDNVYINRSSAEERVREIFNQTMLRYGNITFEGYYGADLTQSLIFDACIVQKVELQE